MGLAENSRPTIKFLTWGKFQTWGNSRPKIEWLNFKPWGKFLRKKTMCPVLSRHFCMSLAEVKHNLVRSKRNWRRCNRRRCGFWHLSSVKIRVGLAAPEPLNLMNDDIRKEGLKMNGSNATDYLDQWINGSNYFKMNGSMDPMDSWLV